MDSTPTELERSTDPNRLDIELIHRFLSTSSYWAQQRSREQVESSLSHSLCFGVYSGAHQIAFGRVVTDYTVFGYLADIFVIAEWRGRGVGKRLLASIVEHPQLKGLPVLLLRTKDAHAFYATFGFATPPRPEELMARSPPRSK